MLRFRIGVMSFGGKVCSLRHKDEILYQSKKKMKKQGVIIRFGKKNRQ